MLCCLCCVVAASSGEAKQQLSALPGLRAAHRGGGEPSRTRKQQPLHSLCLRLLRAAQQSDPSLTGDDGKRDGRGGNKEEGGGEEGGAAMSDAGSKGNGGDAVELMKALTLEDSEEGSEPFRPGSTTLFRTGEK